jgi:predicted O-linked N-acetylglucosamine transferase (SPINDLY family)
LLKLQQASALHQQGRLSDAERLYRDVLAQAPEQADALHFLGILEAQRGRYKPAIELIGRSIALNPGNVAAFYNRGNTFRALNRFEEALESYDQALVINPYDASALTNRGAVLDVLKRPNDALASYERALAIDPRKRSAWNNRGNILLQLRRHDEALTSYDHALAITPDCVEALCARGTLLFDRGRFDGALSDLEKAFALDPNLNYVEGKRLLAKLFLCEWSNLSEEIERLNRHIAEGRPSAEPFASITIGTSAHDQLSCATIYCADRFPASSEPIWRGEPYRHQKIRVGFVSGEFREQVMAYVTADLFECHNKDEFELHGFATGGNDHGPMRRRLEQAFDVFHDVSERTDREIAELTRRSEIDILVNLNGHFGMHRTGAFAYRPSPVQVNYLGFAGTMGAPYIDYIVADRTVIPEDQHCHYSEKVVYLPHTYQPTDRMRGTS